MLIEQSLQDGLSACETHHLQLAQMMGFAKGLYEAFGVKGYFGGVERSGGPWLRIGMRGQAPQPRSGAPKAQGLRARPNP
jgi:hypothetical protein